MDAGAPPEQPDASRTGPVDPGESPSARRKTLVPWLVAAALTVVVALGAVVVLGGADDGDDQVTSSDSASSADTSVPFGGAGGPGGLGTFGTITAVDGGQLTVEATAPPAEGSSEGETQQVTVETTDETAISETVDGTLADLAVGDSVVAIGEEGEAGIEATVITEGDDAASGFPGAGPGGGEGFTPPEGAEGPPPDGSLPEGLPDGAPEGGFPGGGEGGPPGGLTAGEVVAVDGSTLTVRTDDGEDVVVVTSDDTTISISRPLTLADLAEGDTVTVTGETEGEVVTAESIRKGDLAGGFGGGAGGRPQGPPTTTA